MAEAFRYAKVREDGIVTGVSTLAGEVENPASKSLVRIPGPIGMTPKRRYTGPMDASMAELDHFEVVPPTREEKIAVIRGRRNAALEQSDYVVAQCIEAIAMGEEVPQKIKDKIVARRSLRDLPNQLEADANADLDAVVIPSV